MALYRIGEVFGHSVDDHSRRAREHQEKRWCPFRNTPCAKGGAKDPLGICSLSDGKTLVTLCPNRFLEASRIFKDVGRLAFGPGAKIVAAPEIRILRVNRNAAHGRRKHKIGKVDYLVAKLDRKATPIDFAALEVQGVYFSGLSLRDAFRHFIAKGELPNGSERRPDWRSSAQKRLIPQLSLKIPVFRRWGKNFFVAIDSHFFTSLPAIRTVANLANSEVTWLVYTFEKIGTRYTMGPPRPVYSTWDDVLTALREGVPPDPAEILDEIDRKTRTRKLTVYTA